MIARTVAHATFVIERDFDATPARVFAAFADPVAKARWFIGPKEWGKFEHKLDFRVGGREVNRGGPAGGAAHAFNAVYLDIVENQRIIYSYDMHIGDTRISVSLATIELKPKGKGTRLVFTEQGAFLDGYDDAGSRERGTGSLLDQLARSL
ncbi:MAG: SRPBCC family protein [Rhodospirillaceae bacterium]